MPKPLSQFFSAILPVGLSLAAAVQIANAQTGTSVANGDWPVYHGDEFSQRYSPLDQINADNVGSLEIAWRLSTANFGPSTDYNNPSTPLEIDGVLYVNIASTRNVAALDATSGQVLWLWRPQEGKRYDEAPRKGSGRGVAFYHKDGKKRVIDVTPGYQLVSLDADTGLPDAEFGDNGIVDLCRTAQCRRPALSVPRHWVVCAALRDERGDRGWRCAPHRRPAALKIECEG